MAKKYIDAELIHQEIERHLERATAEQEKFPDMPKYRWYLREGKKELCNDLLDYMYDALGVEEPITDSLQQEQSCDTCTNDKGCVTCKDGELWEGKEQSSEDLEEEIDKTVNECTDGYNFGWDKFARHFYELGKQSKKEN